MSTVALAVQPALLGRLLRPREQGAGHELRSVEYHVREIRDDYQGSVSITYQQALVSEVFSGLAEEWREATRFESSLMQSISHPAYRAIVQLGNDAVPVLLKELTRQQPEPWFLALREITGVDPVTSKERGNMRAIAEAWLRWGHTRGLV